MKAIVYRENGSADVLKYEEIEKPVPGDDEVLIRVRAASVNPLDWRMVIGGPAFILMLFGLRKGKIQRSGKDVAGIVENVGGKVTRLKAGDEVFGVCHGAFAEHACAKESSFAVKPDGVTFEQAASLPIAAVTALQGLRDKAKIRPGHKVLVNGAAGGVGTFAVQIAKSFGADVTGVCSTRNMAMVRSLGANRVIDYTREDFARSQERYDIVLDCVGNCAFSTYGRLLNPGGTGVIIGAPKDLGKALTWILRMLVRSWFSRRKVVVFIAKLNKEDLTLLSDLVLSGKVTPVIDRRYALSETRDAMRYAAEGHSRGKVVITV